MGSNRVSRQLQNLRRHIPATGSCDGVAQCRKGIALWGVERSRLHELKGRRVCTHNDRTLLVPPVMPRQVTRSVGPDMNPHRQKDIKPTDLPCF